MKRRTIILAGLEALAMALVTLWLGLQPDRISRATFEGIRLGMTEKEVDAIVGIPPGYYRDGKGISLHGKAIWEGPAPIGMQGTSDWVGVIREEKEGHTLKEWVNDEGDLVVILDKDGRVVYRFFGAFKQPTGLGRIVDRLQGK